MGFLIDISICIDGEQGMLAPADVAAITGNAPVYLSPNTIGLQQRRCASRPFNGVVGGTPSTQPARLKELLRRLAIQVTRTKNLSEEPRAESFAGVGLH